MTPLPKLLVIGGSAGSLDVLLRLLPAMDNSWPLAMIIVLHRKNDNDSLLTELLAAKTTLSVKEAEEKDVLMPGMIYITPSDYHLLIEPDGSLTLDDSEKVNYSRPSIDVTFTSAAEVFGNKLYCILLSGANMDGADGLIAARESGAFTAVQDPEEAEVSFMPRHALNISSVDRVFTMNEMIEFVRALQ
jgi:two-component system chemotaxis response regulator CheB